VQKFSHQGADDDFSGFAFGAQAIGELVGGKLANPNIETRRMAQMLGFAALSANLQSSVNGRFTVTNLKP
jgi:hypothetical protein